MYNFIDRRNTEKLFYIVHKNFNAWLRERILCKIKLVIVITKSDTKNLIVKSNVIQQILTYENYEKRIIHKKICQSDSPWQWWHSTRCFGIRTSTLWMFKAQDIYLLLLLNPIYYPYTVTYRPILSIIPCYTPHSYIIT